MERFTRRMAVVALLALTAGAGFAPAEEDTAQAAGHWLGGDVEFDIAGAYAYPAPTGFDDEPGVRVAISNYEFFTEGMNRLWDREGWIKSGFVDEQTAVVFLHFDKAGSYVGMNWSFGPGSGCGFCFSSSTRSTVQRAGERLAGAVSHADEELSFEVSFDVPIAPTTWGEPLPPDGGMPGKAYLAFLHALDDLDPAALRPYQLPDDQERTDQAAAEGLNTAEIYAESFYPQKARFVRGAVDGEWAQVLVVGESSWGGEAHGEAILQLVDGTWRVWLDRADVGAWPDHLAP